MLQIFCFGCYGRVRAATERNAVYTDHDDTVLPNVHWRVPHRILTISTMSRLNESYLRISRLSSERPLENTLAQ